MSEYTPLDFEDKNIEDYQPNADEKTMALLSHILTLVGGFVAPLVIYLVKKDESAYIRGHAAEALNFQISVLVYSLACIPLIFVVVGVFLLFVIIIGALILTILATVKASEGKFYRYPLTIRLVK